MNTTETSEGAKLHELLSKFETAMLVTHSAIGHLRARPMAVAKVEENCRVWFFTSLESGKVHEIEAETQVAVVCQRDRSLYLSLSGTANLRRDRAKIEELWQEPFRTWFPGGKDDPEIALVSVDPEEGEFWDNEGFNKLKYLYKAVTAYATGTKPEIEEGEQHGKVQL